MKSDKRTNGMSDWTDADLFALNETLIPILGYYIVNPPSFFSDNREPILLLMAQRLLERLPEAVSTIEDAKYYINEFIIEYLRRKLQHRSKVEFLYLQAKNNFYDAGRERVTISLIRNLLGIDLSCDVTQWDVNCFNGLINDAEYQFAPDERTADNYKEYLIASEINLLGLHVRMDSLASLNSVFGAIGLELAICNEARNDGLYSFIFYHSQQRADLQMVVALQEIARSPYWCHNIASSGNLLRRESIRLIGRQKYLQPSDRFELDIAAQSPSSAINVALKNRIYNIYKKKYSSADHLQDAIDEVMFSTVADFHFGCLSRDKDNTTAWAIERGLFNLYSQLSSAKYENSYWHCVDSAIIDWADGGTTCGNGAIKRALELSKTDQRDADLYMLIYLSDNWFYTEIDPYLRERSLFIAGLVVPYLKTDGFAWDELRNKFNSVRQFLADHLQLVADLVMATMKNAVIIQDDRLLDYQALAAEIRDADFPGKVPSELERDKDFWLKVLRAFRKKGAKSQFIAMEIFMDQLLMKALKQIAAMGFGVGQEDLDLEACIYQKYQECGFIEKPAVIKEKDRFKKIASACMLPLDIQRRAWVKYKRLLAGKKVTVKNDLPDPFVLFLQEVLRRSRVCEFEGPRDFVWHPGRAEKCSLCHEVKMCIVRIRKLVYKKGIEIKKVHLKAGLRHDVSIRSILKSCLDIDCESYVQKVSFDVPPASRSPVRVTFQTVPGSLHCPNTRHALRVLKRIVHGEKKVPYWVDPEMLVWLFAKFEKEVEETNKLCDLVEDYFYF